MVAIPARLRPSIGDCRLLQTEPLEGFSIRLKIAGYGGVALAMPVLLWQVWRFVTPGLHRHERHWAVALVAMITPSGDPYTLAMVSIPMYVFYEASIVIGLLLTRGRRRAEAVPAA